jgi:polar amino acid transport system permease protein
VRRVIPPLLNDFIGLQKDTALISVLGPVEALQRANIGAASEFNYTPYVVAAFFFVLITVPQARLTDWLIARDRKRHMAGGRA